MPTEPRDDGPATPVEQTEDGLAAPIDFGARYGAGASRALCLGGGGLYFIAWQVGYLHCASEAGVDVAAADRIVGTSAGSVVAAVVSAGRLGRLKAQVSALGKVPALLNVLAPATELSPSQDRALQAFSSAPDARPETIRRIGHAALAAVTPDPARMRGNLRLIVTGTSWPNPRLEISCVDAYTAERCILQESAKVHPARACAASSAVPGLFPPQPIGDRRCMDGGVSGTGLHSDRVAGAERALVLSLSDGSNVTVPGMTVAVGSIERELAALAASGTRAFVRGPGTVDVEQLMSPAAVPAALADGARQATADLDELREFWA
jgi:NTE family protein